MVFLFGNILEHYLRIVMGTGCSGCFQAKTAKKIFTVSFLNFGLTSLRFFRKIFCWLFSLKRLFLAMRNLGRIVSLFLVCFILQVTTSSIFRKWLNLWRKSWVDYWAFVDENNRVAQVVSGSFLAHTFHFLRPKLFLFRKYLWLFHLVFYLSRTPHSVFDHRFS